MNILITGSSGFLGKSILERLSFNKKIRITGTYRKEKPNVIKENLNYLYLPDLEESLVTEILKSQSFDLLIHCAWEGLPDRSPEITKQNLEKSKMLFNKYLQHGGKNLIAFGSSLENLILNPSKRTLIKSDDYFFGRYKAELLRFLKNSKANFIWIKPYFLYGKNQHKFSLLNMAIENLCSDISWMRDPCLVNDFTYIEDLSEFIYELINDSKIEMKEFDFGTGIGISNKDFVNEIRGLIGLKKYEFDCLIPTNRFVANNENVLLSFPNYRFRNIQVGLQSTLSSLGFSCKL